MSHDVRRLDSPARPGSQATGLWFGILGSLLVKHDDSVLDLGSRKRQLVLAALLCHANSQVTINSLVDTLWEDTPPATARKNIHVYVSSLRRQFRAVSAHPRIIRQSDGYLLQVSDWELDVLAFERRVSEVHARRLQLPADAVAAELRDAISLWRGQSLAGLRDAPLVEAVVERLDARLLTVFEEWAEAEVRAGHAARVIDRITAVAREHPFRERLRMAEMSALASLGRRTEATAIYDELRRALARDLGLSPGEAISRCYQSLLTQQGPDPHDAALERTGSATVTILPPDSPRFTGRDDCVRDLLRAIGEHGERLLVLYGPVGVGKTALAVRCAHQLRAQFPDGQVFVRVREQVCASTAPAWLMRAMAVPGWSESDQDGWTQWRHWLARHRVLVVLDDVPDEGGLHPYLPEAGESAVIVTARRSLPGLADACRLAVPPFTPAEATESLGRVIGQLRVARDPDAASQLVAAVGLLPLGVRALGDKLAGLPHLPLRECLARLRGSPGLLGELTASQGAVAGLLDEAIDDLPDPLRLAYLRLAVLPWPLFTLAKAASLLDADTGKTIRILERLVEAGAIAAPASEMAADTIIYEIPPLMFARAKERGRAAGPGYRLDDVRGLPGATRPAEPAAEFPGTAAQLNVMPGAAD